MQVYKKIFCTVSILISVTAMCFTQTMQMPAMPSMPEVSMPSMPTMESPYYKPQVPVPNSQKNTVSTQNDTQTKETNTKAGTTAKEDNISQNVIASVLGGGGLSALDVSSLYEAGLFDNFSSLAGTSSSNSSVSTNVLLQQILTSLEDLKKQQEIFSEEEKSNLINSRKNSQNFKQRDPSILRFKVNGYVVTDSLTTVFFSTPEADGSFLLTCDRVYFFNQQKRYETIYLLFKTIRNNGSTTIFTVVPTLMQDKENVNSSLYKLCQYQNIEAQKTGNLVAIHCNQEGFSLDMLLDIDK